MHVFVGFCESKTFTKGYRFTFNGKENDNEVKGNGGQQDYGMRVFDPRIGRFLSFDPLSKEFPYFTPYQFSGNSPIENIDLDGLEPLKNGYVTEDMRQGKSILKIPIPISNRPDELKQSVKAQSPKAIENKTEKETNRGVGDLLNNLFNNLSRENGAFSGDHTPDPLDKVEIGLQLTGKAAFLGGTTTAKLSSKSENGIDFSIVASGKGSINNSNISNPIKSGADAFLFLNLDFSGEIEPEIKGVNTVVSGVLGSLRVDYNSNSKELKFGFQLGSKSGITGGLEAKKEATLFKKKIN